MKKIFLLFLLAVLFITGCGGENGSATVNNQKVIIGVDDEFAPICFHDDKNNLVGFDVDLAKEVAKRMCVEPEFKPISWDNKREELISGNVDIIWNGLDITDERKEYMIFSRPYMDDRQILLVREDNDQNINSEGDLEGKVVGVQAGSTADEYVNQDANLKNSLKEFKTYEKFNELTDALKNGEIDVIICDELVGRYEMTQSPDQFEIINVKIGNVAEMAVGFRQDDTELRDKVQTSFDEIIKDGTAKEISEKWFHADLIRVPR
ncbi:MAG: amino acid ABC transporter substrate-binding protein [Selenomonadaceae bacterium]|nr:amino acid ABC transporter substrate-binding protein [Selenomonadaceae bacterium]